MGDEQAGEEPAMPKRPEWLGQSAVVVADEARAKRVPSRLARLRRRVERIFVALCACIGYGAAYGAAFGAICGVMYGVLEPLLGLSGLMAGLMVGALLGALFGAAGGAAGIVGAIIGGRVGWFLAGVLGGAIPPAWLWHLWHAADDFEWNLFLRLIALASVLMGGFLGLALGYALRRGTSALPGVERLAEIINDGSPPARTARSHRAPTEVTPTRAPEGRGDEANPAGTPLRS